MLTFRIKKLLLLLGLTCCCVCNGQGITVSDSLLLRKYLDSVNAAPFFSRRHQLYLDTALMIKPNNAYWWQQKGMPLMKRKKYEAGMAFLDSAVKYDMHKYIDYRAFMKCIFQKSYRSSIADFETAKVVVGAGSVMDHSYDFYIGLCYLMLDRLDSAEYYLTKTIAEQQRSLGSKWVHPLDWFYLGVTYYDMEEFVKASTIFDSSLKLYTTFSDAQYYKAVCLKRMHNDEDAAAVIKLADTNFKLGYTINEDNVTHETYPYQITSKHLDAAMKMLAP